MRRKETIDEYAKEKRWVLCFDLKEESENERPTHTETESSRSQVQCIERISLPGPSCPHWEHGISEYKRLSEEREKESRDEASQRGMEELYQRQCGSR